MEITIPGKSVFKLRRGPVIWTFRSNLATGNETNGHPNGSINVYLTCDGREWPCLMLSLCRSYQLPCHIIPLLAWQDNYADDCACYIHNESYYVSSIFMSISITYSQNSNSYVFQRHITYMYQNKCGENKGIKNGWPCIVEIRGTQGCALVGDPVRAVDEVLHVCVLVVTGLLLNT